LSSELKQAFEIPRIVIAGASSNVGKTTITAGLIKALRQRGLVVQPFKCGPDYVDPSYHEKAAGRPCRNLDTWMLSDSQLLDSFARACEDADIAVVEGVMGLYDGSDWQDERGSTAQIAKLLKAPVLLILDISGSARSAGAAALGYQKFDAAVDIRGVLLNFAGSARHAQGCAQAVVDATGLPMLGWLPRALQMQIPERHLGLVPGGEQVDSDALIAEMAAAVSARFDVDGIVEVARGAGSGARVATAPAPARAASHRAHRPTIAVARDEAFCFYYPENLELLVEEGAAIEFFSPLRGGRPSVTAAGVYLGGGYPELHGPTLASNTGLWSALKDLHGADVPIYAECGGFMVLTEALTDSDGRHWPMAGLLPGVARMSDKLAALGYRYATALRSNLLADVGDTLRGHEFRYSTWVRSNVDGASSAGGAGRAGGTTSAVGAGSTSDAGPPPNSNPAWQVRGTRGDAPADAMGYVRGNLLASYLHVHFGQNRSLAARFVRRLR